MQVCVVGLRDGAGMTAAQEALKAAHGTPAEFAQAARATLGECSWTEIVNAIVEYEKVWHAAGQPLPAPPSAERLGRNAFATGLCVGIVISAFLAAMCAIWVRA
jgi:hypothetical protein